MTARVAPGLDTVSRHSYGPGVTVPYEVRRLGADPYTGRNANGWHVIRTHADGAVESYLGPFASPEAARFARILAVNKIRTRLVAEEFER